MAVDMNAVMILVSAGIEMYERRIEAAKKTALAEVEAELRKQIADGQSAIAAEFARHGVPLPQ